MRHTTKILIGEDKEWATMATEIVKKGLKSVLGKKERRWWSPDEALLLSNEMLITGSSTLKGLLKGWYAKSQHLNFNFSIGKLPQTLTTEQIILLYSRTTEVSETEGMALRRYLAARRI